MDRELPGIRSIDRLSHEERKRLSAVAQQVASEAERFVQQHEFSSVLMRRTWPIAVMMSAGFCDLQPASVSLISRLVLWIFALDDEMDESGQSLEASGQLLAKCRQATQEENPIVEHHRLAYAMAQLRREFSARPSWATMQQPWEESLCQMYRGMQMEHYWQLGYQQLGKDAVPNYPQYMNWAWRSIGVWPMLQSMFALAHDPALDARRPELEGLVHYAATAVRLANDLRSHEKEASEGGINSLLILREERQTGAAEVKEQVFQRMLDALAELGSLGKPLPRGGTDPVGDGARRVTRVLCEFYAADDFHWTRDQRLAPQWRVP